MNAEFDRHAASYEALVQDSLGCCGGAHDFFLRAKAEHLLALVQQLDSRGKIRVLDVGCGVGLMHRWLSNDAFELHGTDVSEASLEKARQRNPSVHYLHGDGVVLPYADGAFDLAFAVCALHHVPPSQWESFVNEMARVVRSRGVVALYEHNPFNPFTQFIIRRSALDKGATLLTAARSRGLLRASSVGAVHTDYLLLTPFKHPAARLADRFCRRLPLGAQYVCYGRRL